RAPRVHRPRAANQRYEQSPLRSFSGKGVVMQIVAITAISLATLGIAFALPRASCADSDPVISGPHVHENLAVYFVHGESAPGPVPLTLQEALGKGSVRVIETGEVNELKVENTGDDDVFIQAGDIVKAASRTA